jgi:hypothetical protein
MLKQMLAEAQYFSLDWLGIGSLWCFVVLKDAKNMQSTSGLWRWIPGSLGRLLYIFLNSAYPEKG